MLGGTFYLWWAYRKEKKEKEANFAFAKGRRELLLSVECTARS